jgi:flagellar biosynthesis GTPase FlhF
MSFQKTADELLALADKIDKDAAEVTKFVCDQCNHTATLAKINAARTASAKTAGENVVVSGVEVDDKIACPACDGVMSYQASAESDGYYYDDAVAAKEEEKPEEEEKDAAKKPSKEEIEEEKKETPEEQIKEEKGEKLHEEPHTASIDYDKLDYYLKG